MFRGERAFWILGKSLPAAWIAREWEIGDAPVSFFRCRSLGTPGQRQRNKKRRESGTSKLPPVPRRGQGFAWNPTGNPTANAFFLLDRARPVLFLPLQKENGGWNASGIPAYSISSLMRSSIFKSFSRHTEAAMLGS